MEYIRNKLTKWRSDELVIWVILACGFTLLLPDAMWRSQMMLAWREKHEVELILALVATISYLVARFGLRWLDDKRFKASQQEQEESIHYMLDNLDHTERAVLREFILRRANTITLPLSEPSVKNLLDSRVLLPSGRQKDGVCGDLMPLSINLLARPHLSYRILGLPVGALTPEQRDALLNARPDFLKPERLATRTHSGRIFRLKAELGKERSAA